MWRGIRIFIVRYLQRGCGSTRYRQKPNKTKATITRGRLLLSYLLWWKAKETTRTQRIRPLNILHLIVNNYSQPIHTRQPEPTHVLLFWHVVFWDPLAPEPIFRPTDNRPQVGLLRVRTLDYTSKTSFTTNIHTLYTYVSLIIMSVTCLLTALPTGLLNR